MVQLTDVEISKVAGADGMCTCFPSGELEILTVNEEACYALCCSDYSVRGYVFDDDVAYCD